MVEYQEPRTLNIWIQTLIFALILLGGIFAFLLTRYLQVVISRRRVRRLSPNLQVIAYFKGILDIVTYYTHPMITGETIKAYGIHKGKRFAFKSDSVFFRDLIDLYNRAKYSPHDITEAERSLMEEAYFDMVQLLRQRRIKIVFLHLLYIRRIGAANCPGAIIFDKS